MYKGLVLSAGIMLAGIAPGAAAAPHQMLRNIDVVAMSSPKPVSGLACVAFFAPDSAALTPMVRRIVASAVQQAKKGRRVTVVVAEAAGLKQDAATAPVWRARVAAVQQAIIYAPAGQFSDNEPKPARLANR